MKEVCKVFDISKERFLEIFVKVLSITTQLLRKGEASEADVLKVLMKRFSGNELALCSILLGKMVTYNNLKEGDGPIGAGIEIRSCLKDPEDNEEFEKKILPLVKLKDDAFHFGVSDNDDDDDERKEEEIEKGDVAALLKKMIRSLPKSKQ